MTHPTFEYEQNLWDQGFTHIIGVDEVGRGAFAGPVVVGAVVFPKNCLQTSKNSRELNRVLSEVNDSKLLTLKKREKLQIQIKQFCGHYSISEIGVPVINRVGIGKATYMAMRKAIASIMNYELQSMNQKIEKNSNSSFINHNSKFYVLVDAFHVKHVPSIGLKNQHAIFKGDQKSISIAAASIIAKVYRDDLMRKLHEKYPAYGFFENKGYGTLKHREALHKNGLSKVHRTSFDLSPFL